MLNSVNDKSPLILQGIIKPERTIYLPGNRGPRGESGDVTQAQMEAYVSDAVADKVTKTQMETHVSDAVANKVTKSAESKVVYTNNSVGEPFTIKYTATPTPNTMVYRDGAGRFQAESPEAEKDVVTKNFAESNFVKRLKAHNAVYAVGADGVPYKKYFSRYSVANYLVAYDNEGYFNVLDPKEDSNPANKKYVDEKVAALVDSAPETLDTLKEVATAIQENETVVEALNSAIGTKANATDVVNLTDDQTISGYKTFTDGARFGALVFFSQIGFDGGGSIGFSAGRIYDVMDSDGVPVLAIDSGVGYELRIGKSGATINNEKIVTEDQLPKLYRHELIFDEFSFSIYTRDSNAYTDVSEFKDKLPEYVPAAYYDDTYAGGVMLHTKYSYGPSDEIDANLTGVVNVWAGDSEVLPINRELSLADAFWEDRVTEI